MQNEPNLAYEIKDDPVLLAVAIERERCAKIIDTAIRGTYSLEKVGVSLDCLTVIADLIRNPNPSPGAK